MARFSVFYTGMFRFPDKDAAGKRVLNVVEALEQIENCDRVIVGGWEQGTLVEHPILSKTTWLSFSLLDKKLPRKFQKLFNYLFMGCSLIPWMFTNRKRYTHVIIYNTPFLFTAFCIVISKLSGKKLILDSTEWYESEHMVGGKNGAAAIENWCRMFLAYPLIKNVIAISSFLEDYYQKKNINVVKIPPMSKEFYDLKSRKSNGVAELNLLYAGSPGKKDRLDQFIQLLIGNKKNNRIIKFYIAGITRDAFIKQFPECGIHGDALDNYCVFLGRIPMEEVISYYDKIDYCVFFREKKRYALAGFPSKYVEALSHGVPVITNGVGDIAADFPHTGIVFEPSSDDINKLIDVAYKNKDTLSYSVKEVFEKKYKVSANVDKINDFLECVR
ncbi:MULTISPECIES: glycosyltransferase [Enterobacteriaceae]|uniref:glycosyltransferase n=1 Tax=Enterobacteriaceae TaxID=543 RepID=UPI00128F56E6|nr:MULTISPECIES: glycosyltransferase [Enterobacteriaceae]EJL9531640.1 glycosyltransferase [Escherichia coli]EJL9654602.1 glycosyltransferase [Escherichia coli]MCZ0184701.1 glycosyltransferase [Escherichia coli]MCZ0194271.1 glycosyltransferase [Escherichia coli]MCZ0386009.1 glycosyltransferase [Escherichia coli]